MPPLYAYECPKCGRAESLFRSIADRHDAPPCCGGKMELIIQPAQVVEDIPPYISPTTGRVIGSRSARRDDLKRSRARPWEGLDAERKEADRQRAYGDAKFDRKLDEGVRSVFYQMPPRKRRVLEE